MRLPSSLNGKAHEPAQLGVGKDLHVSVLTAPVSEAGGAARRGLQIGPFEPAVSRTTRQRYIRELTSTASRLRKRVEMTDCVGSSLNMEFD